MSNVLLVPMLSISFMYLIKFLYRKYSFHRFWASFCTYYFFEIKCHYSKNTFEFVLIERWPRPLVKSLDTKILLNTYLKGFFNKPSLKYNFHFKILLNTSCFQLSVRFIKVKIHFDIFLYFSNNYSFLVYNYIYFWYFCCCIFCNIFLL